MIDLHEAGARLRDYRAEPTPPVAEIISRRQRRRRRRRQRAALAVAVLVVIVAAVGLSFRSGGSTAPQRVVTGPPASLAPGSVDGLPAGEPSATAAQLASGHWSALPPAPIIPRSLESMVWTGRELIVWGGVSGASAHNQLGDHLDNDGAAYDPTTGRWRLLPAAPLSPREAASAVWTGSEMIIWGGYLDATALRVTNDGAAYNPTTNRWSLLAPSPLSPRASALATWTGTSVVFLGGTPAVESDTQRSWADGAIYDPTRNRWQYLPAPAAPPGHRIDWVAAVQTPDGLLAWSQWTETEDTKGPSSGVSGGADLFVYHQDTGHWQLTPPAKGALAAIGDTLWTGNDVIVLGSDFYCPSCTGGAPSAPSQVGDAYDPTTNTWTPLPAAPAASVGTPAWTGSALIFSDPNPGASRQVSSDTIMFDVSHQQWLPLPEAPFACDNPQPPTPVWTGTDVLLYCPPTISTTPEGTNSGLVFTPGS